MTPRAAPTIDGQGASADRGPVGLRWAAVLAWAALVVLISILPGRTLPGPRIPGLDKVAHFVFYAVLALLAQHALRRPSPACWAVVTVSCGLLGAALELVQFFLPKRAMSVTDALANVLGAAAAGGVYVLLSRRRARRRCAA